jgi:hypothetical protein
MGGGDSLCAGGASRLDLRSLASWLRMRESLRVVVDDIDLHSSLTVVSEILVYSEHGTCR